MIGLNAALGMCSPMSAPTTAPDVGDRRHRQRGAQVGPHPPVVGDRLPSRCPRPSANLFVASTCAGAAPGSPMSRAGSWISPPPPTTASTQPARKPATPSSATTPSARVGHERLRPPRSRRRRCRARRAAGGRGASGIAVDLDPLRGRDVGVRDPDRAHAHLLRPVHVLEDPVADVDRAPRRDVELAADRPERLGVRLHVVDLAGVEVGVEQVEHAVALEDAAVVARGSRSCSRAPRP